MDGKFYLTRCPPGRAEGADSWGTYMNHGTLKTPEPEEEIDQGWDEDGNPRPLDYFFNDDNQRSKT